MTLGRDRLVVGLRSQKRSLWKTNNFGVAETRVTNPDPEVVDLLFGLLVQVRGSSEEREPVGKAGPTEGELEPLRALGYLRH